MEDEKITFVTDDQAIHKKGKLSSTDEAIIESAKTGEGLIELSGEKLYELAKALSATFDFCLEYCRKHMTKDDAAKIKELRLEGYSWRALAETCHELLNWPTDEYWDRVPSAQPMGMALCQIAAEFFDEDYMKAPWN